MESEKIVFVPEFTELEFLNEIANFPCLYHHLDPDYKNKEKEECWSQIGETLNCPGNNIIDLSKMLTLLIFIYTIMQILII